MQFDYVIQDELGIHTRPAGVLVNAANKYPCNVTLIKDDKIADMKKIIAVMKMGIRHGDNVTVVCEGEQETEALTEIKEILTKIL